MAMAANLTEAANISYSQCHLLWVGGTIQVDFAAFITDASAIFEDVTPNDRPVGNWLVPMKSLASQMEPGTLPEEQLDSAATYLFRMCLAAASALSNSLISNTQAVALLAAWNANIGT